MIIELSLEIKNRVYEFVDIEVCVCFVSCCFIVSDKSTKLDSFETLVFDDDVGFHSVAEFEIGMVIEFNEGAISALKIKPGTTKLDARSARQRVLATVRDVRISQA